MGNYEVPARMPESRPTLNAKDVEHEIAVLRPEPGDLLVLYVKLGADGKWPRLDTFSNIASRVGCRCIAVPHDYRLELVEGDMARQLYQRLKLLYGRGEE